MIRIFSVIKNITGSLAMIAIICTTVGSGCNGSGTNTETLSASEYGRWETAGRYAADMSLDKTGRGSPEEDRTFKITRIPHRIS